MTKEDWLDRDYCLTPLSNPEREGLGDMECIWKEVVGGQGIYCSTGQADDLQRVGSLLLEPLERTA